MLVILYCSKLAATEFGCSQCSPASVCVRDRTPVSNVYTDRCFNLRLIAPFYTHQHYIWALSTILSWYLDTNLTSRRVYLQLSTALLYML